MTRLWTVHGLPEVRRVPSSEREFLLASSLRAAPVSARLLALAAFVMALVPVLAGLAAMLDGLRGLVPPRVLLVAAGGYAAVACLVAHQVYTRIVRATVRSFLRANWRSERLSVCLHCGYDLRGSAGEPCPECGAVQPCEQAQYHLRRAA
jgi:hypothetical protein